MTQIPPKTKFAIIRKIFRYIFISLLTLLLVAGLIFQAPPKVLTLIAVILATKTLLPKPRRKYIWLTFAGIFVALIIWIFLPDDNQGWKPYTFDKELATLQPPPIPNDQNAATIYNELLETYDANDFRPDFLNDDTLDDLVSSQPWSSNDYPEVADWLKTNQKTIEALLEALGKENCRFPVSADVASLSKSMNHLGPMKKWAQLLIKAVNNDLGDGRTDDAMKKQIAVLQMAKHLYQQPALLDMLVGMAVEALATERLRSFVATEDATEKRLVVIEKTLKSIKHDWSSDLPKIIDVEKLLLKNMLCGMMYEINTEGKTRINRNPGGALPPQVAPDLRFNPQNYWRRKLARAATIRTWFWMPSTPQKAAEIIDSVYEKCYAMVHPDFDWQKPVEETSPKLRLNYQAMVQLIAGMTKGAYGNVYDLWSRAISNNKATKIMIALRRHKNEYGQWPETLEEIKDIAPAEIFIDEINNGTFVYKLTEENFTLYSRGKNNIDENGLRDSKTNTDDILFWPIKNKSCKTNKEKK